MPKLSFSSLLPLLCFIFGVFRVWKEVRRISYSACLYRQKYTPKNCAMDKLSLFFSIYHLEILTYPYGSCMLNTSYNIFYVLFLPLTWEYCTPSFPSGFPPPLEIEDNPPIMRYLPFRPLKNFYSRTSIIERRTVLTENLSWAEEGDSTRTTPVSS